MFRVKSLGRLAKHSIGLSHYIFAAVLFLRLIVLARLSASAFLIPSSGDMQFYNEWARHILNGQWTDHHAFYGLPLYPYLLAFLYKIFGYSPFLPGFFQALLEAGTGVLLYKIAVRIFGQPAFTRAKEPQDDSSDKESRRRGQCIGILAALGWGLFVPGQAYAVILMPTAGLVFVFWFVVWQIVRHQQTPSLGTMAMLGVLMANDLPNDKPKDENKPRRRRENNGISLPGTKNPQPKAARIPMHWPLRREPLSDKSCPAGPHFA